MHTWTLFLVINLLFPLPTDTGYDMKVVKDFANGVYAITIDGKSYLAIPPSHVKQIMALSTNLDSANKMIHRQKSLLLGYKNGLAECKELISNLNVQEVEITEEYLSEPVVSKKLHLDLGVGANTQLDYYLLAGLGYNYFRLWGLYNEERIGIIGGISIPLF